MSTPGELLEALGREARARFGGGGDAATRVYRGRSVEELVPQIQRELGADAIIVRRREGRTGGMMGFFQRAFVEIEAMPGGPGVDVYDEDAAGEAPAAHASPAAGTADASGLAASPAAPAPAPIPSPADRFPVPPAPERAPALEYEPATPTPDFSGAPAPAPTSQQFASPASSAPAAPRPPAMPQRPLLAPAPPAPERPAAPSPFYPREPAAPAGAAGSAYVTAHLAALARADCAKSPPRPSIAERRAALAPRGLDFRQQGIDEELGLGDTQESFAPAAERAPAPPVGGERAARGGARLAGARARRRRAEPAAAWDRRGAGGRADRQRQRARARARAPRRPRPGRARDARPADTGRAAAADQGRRDRRRRAGRRRQDDVLRRAARRLPQGQLAARELRDDHARSGILPERRAAHDPQPLHHEALARARAKGAAGIAQGARRRRRDPRHSQPLSLRSLGHPRARPPAHRTEARARGRGAAGDARRHRRRAAAAGAEAARRQRPGGHARR